VTKLCPVDQRGLGSGPPAGTICGREVPFGGYKTVQNAEDMYAVTRALWDVTSYLEAADGMQPTREFKDFLLAGGEFASTFHLIGHKDLMMRLPGREAGAWMAKAKEFHAAAAFDGSFERMEAWLSSWYAEADRIEREVLADPHPEAWPETPSLQNDTTFRQAVHGGEKEQENRTRRFYETERRLKEAVQARVDAEGLRQELVIYTAVKVTILHLAPQRRARASG
jgi:hypothetical protein